MCYFFSNFWEMLGAIILQYFSGTFLYKFFKAFTREEEDVYMYIVQVYHPQKYTQEGQQFYLGKYFPSWRRHWEASFLP